MVARRKKKRRDAVIISAVDSLSPCSHWLTDTHPVGRGPPPPPPEPMLRCLYSKCPRPARESKCDVFRRLDLGQRACGRACCWAHDTGVQWPNAGK